MPNRMAEMEIANLLRAACYVALVVMLAGTRASKTVNCLAALFVALAVKRVMILSRTDLAPLRAASSP